MSQFLNKYTKESHRVFSLNYHIIFVVKYRKKIFTNDMIINCVKEQFEKISKDFSVNIIEQQCGDDHIHILVSAKPTLDITKYINIMKGHSSRYLRKEYKSFLKDKLWGDNLWTPSYFISSTGNVSIDILKKYIEDQKSNE